MSELSEALKRRTQALAASVLALIDKIPSSIPNDAVCRQLAKSGPAIGANYRAACNGRSRAEFIAKLGVSVEEADETVYWLELLRERPLMPPELEPVLDETIQVRAILGRSLGTARINARQTSRSK
jgi:four helix bundle protein